jgi:hypothetical protein
LCAVWQLQALNSPLRSFPEFEGLKSGEPQITVNAMQRGRKDRLASLLSGLAMAVLLGTLLGIPFWLLGLFA